MKAKITINKLKKIFILYCIKIVNIRKIFLLLVRTNETKVLKNNIILESIKPRKKIFGAKRRCKLMYYKRP